MAKELNTDEIDQGWPEPPKSGPRTVPRPDKKAPVVKVYSGKVRRTISAILNEQGNDAPSHKPIQDQETQLFDYILKKRELKSGNSLVGSSADYNLLFAEIDAKRLFFSGPAPDSNSIPQVDAYYENHQKDADKCKYDRKKMQGQLEKALDKLVQLHNGLIPNEIYYQITLLAIACRRRIESFRNSSNDIEVNPLDNSFDLAWAHSEVYALCNHNSFLKNGNCIYVLMAILNFADPIWKVQLKPAQGISILPILEKILDTADLWKTLNPDPLYENLAEILALIAEIDPKKTLPARINLIEKYLGKAEAMEPAVDSQKTGGIGKLLASLQSPEEIEAYQALVSGKQKA